MTDTHDIFLRAHTVVPDKEQENERKKGSPAKEAPWPDRILCMDCETLTDATQKLNFGAYRLCRLENGRYLPHPSSPPALNSFKGFSPCH
jgi:hypothetical protein